MHDAYVLREGHGMLHILLTDGTCMSVLDIWTWSRGDVPGL
jgi:hypothetical protein